MHWLFSPEYSRNVTGHCGKLPQKIRHFSAAHSRLLSSSGWGFFVPAKTPWQPGLCRVFKQTTRIPMHTSNWAFKSLFWWVKITNLTQKSMVSGERPSCSCISPQIYCFRQKHSASSNKKTGRVTHSTLGSFCEPGWTYLYRVAFTHCSQQLASHHSWPPLQVLVKDTFDHLSLKTSIDDATKKPFTVAGVVLHALLQVSMAMKTL